MLASGAGGVRSRPGSWPPLVRAVLGTALLVIMVALGDSVRELGGGLGKSIPLCSDFGIRERRGVLGRMR